MSDEFTTQGIDNLAAHPLADGGYEITFRSTNAGLCHQLYVNGRLADWSEDPSQRSFFLAEPAGACRLMIVATSREHRQTDFSAPLAAEGLAPLPWVFATMVLRGPGHQVGDRVALLDDQAQAQAPFDPVAVRDIWPAWTGRLGWGQDALGLGVFGYDAHGIVGFGRGLFGGGPLGLDADAIPLEAAMPQEGRHRLVLRTLRPNGQFTDGPEIAFLSYPPPPPPQRVVATSYDAETGLLTLQVHRG